MLRKMFIVPAVLIVVMLASCGPVQESLEANETRIAVEAGIEVVVTATPEPEPTETPKAELEGLWYPIGDPTSLDPQLPGTGSSWTVIEQCIEGLFEYRGDGSIEPTGATGYEVSDDGRIYTIHLRRDAVWSDGVPVIAQHFVDGVIRLLHPDTEAAGWLLYDVEGAEAFNSGESDDPATVGIRAVDDHTLEIRLEVRTAYFDKLMPLSIHPVRVDIVDQHGAQWTEPGNYVSNGPYLLDIWEHEVEVVLVKNPTYHSADSVSIERITLPAVSDSASQLALFENDELHVSGYPSDEVSRILGDPILSQQLQRSPMPGVYYFGLNTLRPPTDDVRVRQALASAIDRKSIVEDVLQRPWVLPLSCTTPAQVIGYQEWGTCGHTYDPEKARQLLAEAGYPDGEGFPTLLFWFNSQDYNESLAKAVAATWEEILNIDIELRFTDWDVYLDHLNECATSKEVLAVCDFNVYRNGWVMDYGDPHNQLYFIFAPSSTFQYTGWENAHYEDLLELARNDLNQARREGYYEEADRILCEQEAVIIPIHGYERATLVKDGVTFEFPPFGTPHFKNWALP